MYRIVPAAVQSVTQSMHKMQSVKQVHASLAIKVLNESEKTISIQFSFVLYMPYIRYVIGLLSKSPYGVFCQKKNNSYLCKH